MKKVIRRKDGRRSQIFRYVRGEMSKREENAFQRKLQRDPFTDEAVEGYSQTPDVSFEDDLTLLEEKLKRRIPPRRRMIYYRIAASVAVLMIISSVYFILNRNQPADEKEPGELVSAPVTLEIPQSTPIGESGSTVIQGQAGNNEAAEGSGGMADKQSGTVNIADAITESVKEEKIDPAVTRNEKEAIKTTPAAEIMSQAIKINIAEERLPNQADEATVSARKSVQPSAVSKAEAQIISDAPPLPSGGMASYEKYIAENIKKPVTLAAGDSAIVIIEFVVTTTGTIDSVRMVQSPGIEYTSEAERLLMDGPRWTPAVMNGDKVERRTQVKITFR